MIKVSASAIALTLPKALYPRESLESGALAVGERAKVFLETKGKNWAVTLKPVAKTPKEALLAAAGRLMNEALSHAHRQRVIAFNRDLTAPVLARALDAGFPNIPPDPLEQLEPQVRADREQDVAALLEAAKKWL